jgi:hypothetical protein
MIGRSVASNRKISRQPKVPEVSQNLAHGRWNFRGLGGFDAK